MEILVIISTETCKTNALRMGKLLIQYKLAACVSIKQIFSIYEWDDDIEENKEFEITIKSKPEFKDKLIDFLNKISTYDVPQIIYKKYHAEIKYYDWINKQLFPKKMRRDSFNLCGTNYYAIRI